MGMYFDLDVFSRYIIFIYSFCIFDLFKYKKL